MEGFYRGACDTMMQYDASELADKIPFPVPD